MVFYNFQFYNLTLLFLFLFIYIIIFLLLLSILFLLGDYGCYEASNGDVLVTSDRAAKGMAYQSLLKDYGVATSLLDMKGSDLLGLPLKAPNCTYERVYTLPLLTISMGKGKCLGL